MSNPLLAVLSVALSQNNSSYQPSLSVRTRPRPEGGWLTRKRKARLLRLLTDDQRKDMSLPANKERNGRRWKAYFELIGEQS